jgi:hypothetical protein
MALFQKRIDGDDALLSLAALRFAQAGLGAEVYAHDHRELEHVLGYVPDDGPLPVVHLDRGLDLLRERDRAHVAAFAHRFAGRVSGLVVHDKKDMVASTDELVRAMTELGRDVVSVPSHPVVFLEYAAGHPPAWFVEVAQSLRNVEGVSVCVDVGHIGIREARRSFAEEHGGPDLATLRPIDARTAEVACDVERAVRRALPVTIEVTRALGEIGKPLHFHLHDGHPLIPGLSDHRSFFTRVPVPLVFEGRRALHPLYGPAGLGAIAAAVADAAHTSPVSLTLEIHETAGRLPLDDAAGLFRGWRDTTNAERMNQWLAVLSANGLLLADLLGA